MGHIIEVYPGRDSVVHSVKLKTSNDELSRPSALFCLLETADWPDSFLIWEGRIFYVETLTIFCSYVFMKIFWKIYENKNTIVCTPPPPFLLGRVVKPTKFSKRGAW